MYKEHSVLYWFLIFVGASLICLILWVVYLLSVHPTAPLIG